jgi:hypothetical protein
VPAFVGIWPCDWGVGRRIEAVSTVFIIGVGLKVTVRAGFRGSPLFGADGDSRGVLSVAAVEAIMTEDLVDGNYEVKVYTIFGPWAWSR